MNAKPWRLCPFTSSKSYRPKKDFTSSVSSFRRGECLKFNNEHYSPYDGSTVYTFQTEAGTLIHWLLRDEELVDSWKDYFEPTP